MSQGSVSTLEAHNIPLEGIHLIEASAGTGKTFNITRIYLRLLLERKLKVQNLLVVTFTKAATEELKGRIDFELRDTLARWGRRDAGDAFYQSLESKVSQEQASITLRTAIGDLDEASIFTIHGFCKRVLSQHAFESGLPFDLEMEVDSYELKLEAVRDWYRRLESTPKDYLEVTNVWSCPEVFTDTFVSLLGKALTLEGNSPDKIIQTFIAQKADVCRHIEGHAGVIFQALIDSHKDKINRTEEYHTLIDWLNSVELDAMPKSAGSVFDGKRYARKQPDIKAELNELFQPLKDLKQQAATLDEKVHRAQVDLLATDAISIISKTIIKRKKQSAQMDFDDLVTSLLDSLTNATGEELARHLVAQYPVALVDEFQDTDPSQYAVFDKIYNSPSHDDSVPRALYMIGDPKQAIYGFRGGDVFAYLTARDRADQQWYMDTNWRSSSGMIESYNRLFYGQAIPKPESGNGHTQTTHVFNYGIGYSPVKSAAQADKCNLSSMFCNPLKYIYFPEDENYGKNANNQQFRAVIADWCANEIKQLLSDSPTDNRIHDAGPVPAIEARDIAVLVRDRVEAEEIQIALSHHGCASVYLSNRENVFLSHEAAELLTVLMGILLVEDDRMLTAALATRLCGFDSQQLYKLQEDEMFWEDHRIRFLALRNNWLRKGLMATLFKLIHQSFKPDAQRQERSLTNIVHLLELLQSASQKHRQPWELVSWFRDKIENPSSDSASELRLESDDNLIQIVTLHGSKGLEYPVVFIPFATRAKGAGNKKPSYYDYHDERTKEPKTFVGYDKHIQAMAERERAAEDVRLLYVAITRAEYACYIGVTPFSDYPRSPLGLMLGLTKGDDLLAAVSATVADTPLSAEVINVAAPDRSARFNHDLMTSTALCNVHSHDGAETQHEPTITVERMTRDIEDDWWVSSFSAITRNLKHGVMAEPDRDNTDASGVDELKQTLELRFTLKKGAAAGNLLHDALETVDFQQPSWTEALRQPLIRFGDLEEGKGEALVEWLDECLAAELSDGLTLNALAMNKTLREVEFYFPIDSTSRKSLSGVLQHHRQSKKFPQLPDGAALKGMMHGFIDLVFEWQGKYYIADYKSTHLGDEYSLYDHANLSQNIQDNYYDLQYLIYCLALHRYLKQRIEDYTPASHFGGVYYLYLRGMGVNGLAGVYYAHIDTELLDRLDNLFGHDTTEIVEGGDHA